MTLLTHGGTAAIDLRSATQIHHDEMEEALNRRLGKPIPNVAALSETSKDWIYENGLHHPPINYGNYLGNYFQAISGATSTAFTHPLFIGSAYSHQIIGTQFASPPTPLPVQQREMPVIGYRSWKFGSVYKLGRGRKGCLLPLNESYGPWVKGKNSAKCQTGSKHTPAQEFCYCGFYVLSSLDQAEHWTGDMADNMIVGAVMGWGRVVQHGEEGWRAQYAQIIALLDCQFSAEQSKNTQTIAKTYDLEVKSREQLEALVSEFGEPFQKAEINGE